MKVYVIAQKVETELKAFDFIDQVCQMHQDLEIAYQIVEVNNEWLVSVFWAFKEDLVVKRLQEKTVQELKTLAKSVNIKTSGRGYKKVLKNAKEIRFDLENMPSDKVALLHEEYRTKHQYIPNTFVLKQWVVDSTVQILTEEGYAKSTIQKTCNTFGISQYKQVFQNGITLTKQRLINKLVTESSLVWEMFGYWY